MYRKYVHITGCLIVLLLSLFLTSCQQRTSSEVRKSHIDKTIARALSWVYGHPAHFAEGGFIEIAEEIITFYILNNHSDYKSKSNRYMKEIQKRLELIASKKDFKIQPPEYSFFLVIAHISEKLGLKPLNYKKIIEDQLLSDPLLYPPHVTSRIWNMLYLERLGYTIPLDFNYWVSNCTLYQELHQKLLFRYVKGQFDPGYAQTISMALYDIAHEVFSMTDFGDITPPPVILENRAFFSELFNECITWAITAQKIDTLAEAIKCVKILDLENVPSLDRGIEFIISQQKGNGSFGMAHSGRPNPYRHNILVSIMALSLS
ncbi:MAG: DUF6895 family protein [bacterium]